MGFRVEEMEGRDCPACVAGPVQIADYVFPPAVIDVPSTGPVADGPLPVYLDLPPGYPHALELAGRVAALADPLDRLHVVLAPPDDFPGDYLTVVFQAPPLGWVAGHPHGFAPVDLRFPANRAQPRAVYVSLTDGFGAPRSPDELAASAVHEVLHTAGLAHVPDRGNILADEGTGSGGRRIDNWQVFDARNGFDVFLDRLP